jgi:hypothetical protein
VTFKRQEGGLEGKDILPKSRGRSRISTHSSHNLRGFESVDHAVLGFMAVNVLR